MRASAGSCWGGGDEREEFVLAFHIMGLVMVQIGYHRQSSYGGVQGGGFST